MSEKNPEESLVTAWADAQQKLLTDWLDLMQDQEQPSRSMAWNETVKAWQTAVDGTLDAQARWLREWTGRVQVTSGSPTELRKNVRQAQVVLLRWVGAVAEPVLQSARRRLAWGLEDGPIYVEEPAVVAAPDPSFGDQAKL